MDECSCEWCCGDKPLTFDMLKENLSIKISCDNGSGEITVGLLWGGKEISSYSTYFEHTSNEVAQAIDNLKYRTM